MPSQLRIAKSLSPWREGVARQLVRPIAVEWPLMHMQRSVASQDDEWQFPAAAVIGLHNLTGGSQPSLDLGHARVNCCSWPIPGSLEDRCKLTLTCMNVSPKVSLLARPRSHTVGPNADYGLRLQPL